MLRTARTTGLALLLALVGGGPASAGPETPATAAAAGAKARAGLPAPAEGNGLAFEGEIWTDDGVWIGTVRLKADPGTYDEKPAWYVTEDVFTDRAGVETRWGASYTLARDLTFLRGEVEHKDKDQDVVTRWTLSRGPEGVSGNRQVVRKGVEGAFEPVAWKTPGNAAAGLTALVLFLRGPLPTGEKQFQVPWMDNHWGHVGAARSTDVTLTLQPPAELAAAPGKPKAVTVDVRVGVESIGALHVDPKERSLLGFRGLEPASAATVLKAGARPEGAKFDEEQPARTWQDAFRKFGVGFHMARADVLAAAFHWPSMYDHETGLPGGWPRSRPLAEFRQAWVDAFLEASKRRTRAETDELLRMTLASGRLDAKDADRVVFHAHKNFGGGVQRDYHLRRIDHLWYIVRIDSAE